MKNPLFRDEISLTGSRNSTLIAYMILWLANLLVIDSTISVAHATDQSCEEAAQTMSRSIKENIGSAHQLSTFRQALSECDTLVGGHYNLAVSLLSQGNVEEAIFQFQIAKKQNTDPNTSFNISLGLGNALLTKGDLEGAKAEYQALLDNDPQNTNVMVGLAVVSFRQGDMEQANILLSKATSIDPDNTVAALNYGILQQKTGKLEKAIKIFSSATQKAKDDLELNLRLASALLEAGRLDEAGQVLTRLNAQAPNDSGVLATQGIYLQQKDQNEAAKKVLEQAKAIIPKNRAVIVALAAVSHSLNEDTRSRALMEEALLYYPEDTSVLNASAWFFIETEDFGNAEAMLLKSISLDPSNKQAHSYLAKLYEYQGNEAKAAEHKTLADKDGLTAK